MLIVKVAGCAELPYLRDIASVALAIFADAVARLTLIADCFLD